MEMRFEAWTRPESGTFERLFPLTGISQWSMKLGLFGQGLMVLPSDHPRLTDLLYVDPSDHSNDQATMIRAYVGDVNFYDFYASRVSIDVNETGSRVATLTGGGPGSSLERTRVRPYDYPELPSIDPDWVYGYGPSLVTNGDFEDTPETIGNPGAEDGTTLPWYTTGDPDTGIGVPNTFDAIYDNSEAHSGDWSFLVHADAYEGVRQDFPTTPGEDYPISVWVKAAIGVQYRVSCDGASAAVAGTFFNGSAYVDGVGDGTWQEEGITITADDGGQGRIHITSRQTGGIFRFDDVDLSGFGIGTNGWKPNGELTAFEASTTQAHGGSYSLKWRPDSGVLGNDKASQQFQVRAGKTVVATAWVYHTEAAARDFRLVMAPPGVDPNFAYIASVLVSVPPSTWTEIPAAGVSNNETVVIDVRYDETGAPVNDLFLDDVDAYQGRIAATAGAILGELEEDAAIDHTNRTALAFLTDTFDSTDDSNGDPWDDTLALTVKRGQTYRRFVEILQSEYGYEARIRPNPADETVLWFDVYNPDGMGTDHSAGDGGAVGMGGVVGFGPVIRREPQAVYAMVEGRDQYYGEALDLTLRGAWGDIETYEGSDEVSVGNLQTTAAILTDGRVGETVSVKFADPPLIPGIDYGIGDLLRLSLSEDLLPSDVYRVVDISVQSGDPEPVFQVQFVYGSAGS